MEELHRINLLIENILFLAQTENPQLALTKNPIFLAQEIKSLYRFYHAKAEDKKIQLHSEGEAGIIANSIMIRRMLSNLLSNAINYSHEGANIFIEIQDDNSLALIKVIDNGPGIPPEHLPYITHRFYRAKQIGRTSKGTGLGLAIVQSIVDIHKGKMSIMSELGVGTTVSVWLPKQ